MSDDTITLWEPCEEHGQCDRHLTHQGYPFFPETALWCPGGRERTFRFMSPDEAWANVQQVYPDGEADWIRPVWVEVTDE